MQWKHNLSWWGRFSEQPHQLFFASSLLMALIVMIFTMGGLLGKNEALTFIHPFILFYGVFSNAFLGFLMTVLPRYLATSPLERPFYLPIWLTLQSGIVFSFILPFVGALIVALALILSSIRFEKLYKESRIVDKKESKWLIIMTGLGGILSIIVSIVLLLNENISTIFSLIFWIYLLPLIFTVAQKMIPAFYSVSFNEKQSQKPKFFLEYALLGFFLIGITTSLTWNVASALISLLLAGFLTVQFAGWSIWRKATPILWILPVGLVWLIVGLFLNSYEALNSDMAKLGIHTLALGFATTLLIGFGTRVILGHSGQAIHADRLSVSLFILTQVIVIIRISGSLLIPYAINIMPFFHASATLWLILFVVWGIRYGKVLLRIKG